MERWGRIGSAVASTVVVAGLLAACQVGAGTGGSSSGSTGTPSTIAEHEAGPESPIIAGLTVPTGAVQLGPLARMRSERIVAAYQADLTVALTRQGVSDAVSAASGNPDGVLQSTPPVITKSGRPDDDTFALLEEPPPADITVAVIRLGESPTEAVQSIVSQIADLLPDAGVRPDDFASYCTVVDDRVTGCQLDAEGVTADDRELAISVAVDPGNLQTRVAPPSSQMQPVMEVRVENLSDPRLERPVADGTDVGEEPADEPAPAAGESSAEDVIWPAMDTQAPADAPLLNGWVAPADAQILLSSSTPSFVSLQVPRSADAREIARSFVESLSPDAAVRSDSYEGLNEVDVTFTATAPDGSRAVGTHVITARGNYVMLFYTPPS